MAFRYNKERAEQIHEAEQLRKSHSPSVEQGALARNHASNINYTRDVLRNADIAIRLAKLGKEISSQDEIDAQKLDRN